MLLCSLYSSVSSLTALIHRVLFNLVHAGFQTTSHSSRITILRRAFQFEKFMKRVTLLLTFNDTCGIGKRRSEWNGIASLFQNVCSIIQEMTNSILNNIVLVAMQVFLGCCFIPAVICLFTFRASFSYLCAGHTGALKYCLVPFCREGIHSPCPGWR